MRSDSRVCKFRLYMMAESRKSIIEMTSLEKAETTKQERSTDAELGVHKESKEPMPCTSLDEVKAESSPTSGATLNVEMTYLDMGDRKIENTDQGNSPEDDPYGYKETNKPVPCRTSDGFYAEQLIAPESSLTAGVNVEMPYTHKPDENGEKYSEIIDDVTIPMKVELNNQCH